MKNLILTLTFVATLLGYVTEAKAQSLPLLGNFCPNRRHCELLQKQNTNNGTVYFWQHYQGRIIISNYKSQIVGMLIPDRSQSQVMAEAFGARITNDFFTPSVPSSNYGIARQICNDVWANMGNIARGTVSEDTVQGFYRCNYQPLGTTPGFIDLFR